MNRLLLLPLVLFIGLVAFLLVGLRRDPHELGQVQIEAAVDVPHQAHVLRDAAAERGCRLR